MTVDIAELKKLESKIHIYRFLDKHLDNFFVSVTGSNLNELGCGGTVSAHGDKGRGAAMKTRKAGIPFPHMMMIYLLSYTDYCKANFGEVRIDEWIISEYPKLKKHLPNIDLSDNDILK